MKMKIKLTVLTLIVLFSIISIYYSGYRLDGLSAAKANKFVPQDSILLDQVDYNWGSVYIFNSEEKPVTAISFKKFGLLWVSRLSVYYFHNEDLVKTVGGVSLGNENEKATVMSVLVDDPKVAYLETGPVGDRRRKDVTIGKPISFSWNTTIQWNDLNAKAFSDEGKLLYEYRFAQTNYTRIEDLKWYPVN